MTLTIFGLDLGQRSDYSALAVVEAIGVELTVTTREQDPEYGYWHTTEHTLIGPPVSFACRFLRRWPLGTIYPKIVADVRELLGQVDDTLLAIDLGGVGLAVGNLFSLAGIGYIGVGITSGRQANPTDLGINVPKRDLVGAVQVALQCDRLKIAAKLPEASTLIHELTVFDGKLTETGYEVLEARSGQHDDLLVALCLACWIGERAIVETLEANRAQLEVDQLESLANQRVHIGW